MENGDDTKWKRKLLWRICSDAECDVISWSILIQRIYNVSMATCMFGRPWTRMDIAYCTEQHTLLCCTVIAHCQKQHNKHEIVVAWLWWTIIILLLSLCSVVSLSTEKTNEAYNNILLLENFEKDCCVEWTDFNVVHSSSYIFEIVHQTAEHTREQSLRWWKAIVPFAAIVRCFAVKAISGYISAGTADDGRFICCASCIVSTVIGTA